MNKDFFARQPVIDAWVQQRSTWLFSAILGKGPWHILGKNDRLNIKIGRNYDIEHILKIKLF